MTLAKTNQKGLQQSRQTQATCTARSLKRVKFDKVRVKNWNGFKEKDGIQIVNTWIKCEHT